MLKSLVPVLRGLPNPVTHFKWNQVDTSVSDPYPFDTDPDLRIRIKKRFRIRPFNGKFNKNLS